MSNKLWPISHDGKNTTGYMFMCPGCGEFHGPDLKRWTFNGDLENPTFRPSIGVRVGDEYCHSYVTNGKIEFLGDSTHALKGQTVDMTDMDELRRQWDEEDKVDQEDSE